jgi:glycerol uptake facilitator-like aquaporin
MPSSMTPLPRRVVAEAVGTAFILSAIVGSGIMGARLAGGNVAIALLANTLATAATLVAVILAFAPISGAHFNPVVTLVEAVRGRLARADVPAYVVGQIAGGLVGVLAAHLMFGEPFLQASTHMRAGWAQAFSECVATFGLLSVIWGCSRTRPDRTAFAVGLYIAGAYWFTASTSFANPAVTIARAFTDTFAGIRPADVAPFLAAQGAGAAAAVALFRWLLPEAPVGAAAASVVRTDVA